VIEIIVGGETRDVHGVLGCLHGERLALAKLRGFFLVQYGSVARQNIDVAAIVKIVDAEGPLAAGLNREIAAGHAEIIAAGGVYVERSGALPENQTGSAGAVIERKIEEFENRVLVQKGHRAIFEFDFGAAMVRGNHVALTDGQVGLGRFPLCLLVGERVAMSSSRKTHIAFD